MTISRARIASTYIRQLRSGSAVSIRVRKRVPAYSTVWVFSIALLAGVSFASALAPVYDWFSEGFDTPDLKDAKALLEDLA